MKNGGDERSLGRKITVRNKGGKIKERKTERIEKERNYGRKEMKNNYEKEGIERKKVVMIKEVKKKQKEEDRKIFKGKFLLGNVKKN